jgi:hypothetical protein
MRLRDNKYFDMLPIYCRRSQSGASILPH